MVKRYSVSENIYEGLRPGAAMVVVSASDYDALAAELAIAKDAWHMANGTADLAIQHRNVAEDRVQVLEAALRAVTCGEFSGIQCNAVDGRNWFDVQAELLGHAPETPGEYKPEAVARILAARDAPAERSFPNGEGLMEWLHDGKPETPVYPYQQPSNLPAQSISNTTTCPKCGGPYLSIPRMGISHICSEPKTKAINRRTSAVIFLAFNVCPSCAKYICGCASRCFETTSGDEHG